MERERFRKNEINRNKKFVSNCNECGKRMSVNQACEHLAIFHPQIVLLLQKISNKVKSFPVVKRKFPPMDCINLCAAKIMANRLIENFARYDPHSLVLIQQLSGEISSVSDFNCIFSNQKNCSLCGLRFLSTRLTIAHLMLRHPECLALVQFLRCRPLSELNFQKDVVALSKTKTQDLIRVITSPTVLASRQPFVKLEKLPSHWYQECITKGYVKMKEVTGTRPLFGVQPNSRLKGVSAEVMKKIRETVENTPYPYKSNITVIVVPKKIFKVPQGNSEMHITSHNEDVRKTILLTASKIVHNRNIKNAALPTTSKIIRYGVEDLERDRVMRQQEREKIGKKEEILKKMLAKYHEKETKKEVLYWQKVLTRYVMQHRKVLSKIENNLVNARKQVTSRLCGEQLLERVDFCVTERYCKIKKTLRFLLKKLFDAMEKVPTIKYTKKLHLTSGNSSFEKVDPIKNITVKNTEKLHLTSGDSSFEKVDPIKSIAVKHTKRQHLNSEEGSLEKVDPIKNMAFKNTKKLHLNSGENSFEKVVPIKNISVKNTKKQHLVSGDNSFEKGDPSKNISAKKQHLVSGDISIEKSGPIKSISLKNKTKQHLTSGEHSFEKVNEPPRRGLQKCSTPNVRNDQKSCMPSFPAKRNSVDISSTSVCDLGSDPFVNPALITDDKQFMECFCGKLNCVGLHPENFY